MRTPPLLPFLAILAVSSLTACAHRLPPIKAKEIHQSVSFPGFSSTADATGISVSEAQVRAADVSWRIAVMGVAVTTSAKDYEQKREKDDKP